MTSKQINEIEQAAREGKSIQIKRFFNDEWYDAPPIVIAQIKAGQFNWTSAVDYWRIAPSPVTVPLGPEDAPPGSVINCKIWPAKYAWDAVISVTDDGVYAGIVGKRHARLITWNALMTDYQISRDNGKTWQPCSKEQKQ